MVMKNDEMQMATTPQQSLERMLGRRRVIKANHF